MTRRPIFRAPARALPALLLVAGCAVNPATGERQLSLIGEAEEIRMGQEADEQIVRQMGLYEDEELQAYVDRIGREVAAVSERPDLPWTFRVIDDPTVNAFAVPGGFVYLTRGILTHLTSEAELAGILGHEVGHITARHSVNQMSKAQLTQLGVGVGMILVPELQDFAGLAGVGMQLLFLKFGREDENESDRLGVRYMSRLGYDPGELADVMAMLERSSEIQQGSGRLPQWLSTHPDPANRVENILELASSTTTDPSSLRVERAAYMAHLDGVVFGNDPREGYFDDGVFHHPELRFRIDFPRGWRSVNTKRAVQSVSPEEDAVLLLTIASGSAREAMRDFSSESGVRVRDVRSTTLDGLPAVAGDFQATTERTTLVGRVAFVEHVGSTFRLLGYTPSGVWRERTREVVRTIESFAVERDPDVLDARPDRIDLVEPDAAMPVSTFMERYPSAVGPEIVELINMVPAGGRFPAGETAKRVAGGR